MVPRSAMSSQSSAAVMQPMSSPPTKGDVCGQCRRRKQKCDRALPCSNCTRRGVPHLCQPVTSDSNHAEHHAGLTAQRPLPAFQSTVLPTAQYQASNQSTSRAPAIGRIWNTRGAPTYHGDSYFGHQAAADMMQMESPELSMGVTSRNARTTPRINGYKSEKTPNAHLWELLGYLPRQKSVVNRLVTAFLRELNQVFDGVHEETFLGKYEAFWNRRWGDDDAMAIDLRWLSLLFIVLAFGELLDCPCDASMDMQDECQNTSLQFYWAARTSITLSATFWGESSDTVRASILVTRYLVYTGRKTEGWLSSRFSISFAQAQGMHIDGENWRLPPKVLETRRRLWCTCTALEKYISLGLGRPSSTTNSNCMKMNIRNIWIDEKSDEEALTVQPSGPEEPTPSAFYIYEQDLAIIVGRIQNDCFGLIPLGTSYNAYEKVLDLDKTLVDWADRLPPYFRVHGPDMSLDESRPYLYWQRMSLQSAFHFARVTLHRAYLLRDSLTNRFQYSHDACVSSACADLSLKLSLRKPTIADRLRAGTVTHNLCSSALVLGIIAVREPVSARTSALLQDLAAYCEKQNSDPWANEFLLAEVRVIELCIASAQKLRQDAGVTEKQTKGRSASVGVSHRATPAPEFSRNNDAIYQVNAATSDNSFQALANVDGAVTNLSDDWLDAWFGPSRTFPDPGDFQSWESLVGTLESLQ